MIEYILNPQSIEALGWTLLHSLWQGAVFAILLVLILIALRSYSAKSRYVVSVGVLCAFFLTLTGTFWQQWQTANFNLAASQHLNEMQANDAFLQNSPDIALQSENKNLSGESVEPEVLANGSSWLNEFSAYYQRHLPLLVTIWLLGILFLQLRVLGQLAYLQRLKHYGAELFPNSWTHKIEELEGKLRIRKKVQYLTSIRIESPMVIGWLKPVVLIPRQLFNGLSETEIYAVLAHELAHIRREDFIINLLQTFLCNVFFFHPGVWWMSNRIDDEREHCCDDLAVAATGPVATYAKTLINVSEFQLKMQHNAPLAMSLAGKNKRKDRGGFSARIRRLFMANQGAGSFREGFSTAFILITAIFLGLAAMGSTFQATDATNSIEADKNIMITQSEISTLDEMKPNPQESVTTSLEVELHPNTEINQVLNQVINQNELPIAAPQPPVAPAPPADPVQIIKSKDARVDALVMACKEGDFDFVKTLIKTGVDINGIGTTGFSPLMMATSHDESKIVAYLLKEGADVNLVFNGWTALLEAADEGALASMKLLLAAGAKVNFFWTTGSRTAISMAASEGKLNCLKLLLKNGADINGVGKSVPPLHIAAEEGKRSIIEYLIQQKVKLNKIDYAGRTALMYAASEGKKYTVIQLVDAGANAAISDLDGFTAKDYAEEEDHYRIGEYLSRKKEFNSEKNIESNSEKKAEFNSERKEEKDELRSSNFNNDKTLTIHQATSDGLIEKVQLMVEQGTDVNIKDKDGRTPLHIASLKNHNIDMRVLIELGADVNAQDYQGRTPLMYAASTGKRGATVLLVSEKALVNLKDAKGMTAYDWSKTGENPELTNFLRLITSDKNGASQKNRANKSDQKEQEKNNQKEHLKRETFHIADDGVHLRQFDIKKKTPELLKAARNGLVADCAKLLNNGLPVNTADDTGQTALMAAARTNQLDIAKFLIAQGADVNKSSSSGLTALHYAALENHDQMARLLLTNNAKVDPTMRYSSTDGNYTNEPLVWEYIGATPLLIAIESGKTAVAAVLIEAGANTKHTLIKNEYRLNKDRPSYLSGGEVMGIDEDFLKEVEFKTSEQDWTPYKQALLLNDPKMIALFKR